MNESVFGVGLRTLCSQLPFGKKPADDEISFLWMVLPQSVTTIVTDRMWGYAIQQRLLDPEPNSDLPICQQLFSYLFRLRDGRPDFELGLRPDLPERMNALKVFHPLSAPRAESALFNAPQLPEVPPRPPKTREQRIARLLALAEATGVDLSAPPSPLEEGNDQKP
jgi:hypothetical protein